MIRTGSSAGKKKRKFKVDEGRPACKPPFKTNCIVEKKSDQSKPKIKSGSPESS
jgi:hypothetical protein